ncbi:MAG: LuxR C-terminal-related transcriptional regulator [Candidatus Eremiobacteraeota bacterium]|nr:LuxR C-terminal-related transcriptional regulator [Candidatus Eremiobacteraeota bacterium]
MIRPVRSDGKIETGGVFSPVVRRRVIDRISSAAMQRIVLIVAPAGYGKSVALAQYLASTNDVRVRFDVLSDHATLLGFLRGFTDALVEIAPDARTTLAGAYEKNADSPSAGSDLAMWMHSHLKSYRGIIAIDDLHTAQEDREVTRFLSALIERTKGRVQWIIASRSTLGLPIGTWLAYGDSDLAIDEHDLKFSVDEAKEAARTFRLGVRDDELHELLNLTEGWATAMSFALRSSTRSIDLRSISTMTREMIYRYLAEQVYAGLDASERRFIETAALLPSVDVETMAAAGFNDAASTIEDLRQRVAFVHEQAPGTYRLHDLFREFAQHQLSLQGRQAGTDLRVMLGSVLEARGNGDLALNLFVDAQDVERVTAVLVTQGTALIARGHGDTVKRALDAIPPDVHAREALLSGLSGVIDIAAGRYDSGERFLQRAIRLGEDVNARSEHVLRLAMFLVNQGRDPDDLLRSLLTSQAAESAKLEARAMLAVRCVRAGKYPEADRYIAEVERSLGDVDDIALLARLLQRIGLAKMERPRAAGAKQHLIRSAELAGGIGLWSLASRAYQGLSTLIFFSDSDVTLALWYAQQAASSATKAGDYFDLQISLLQMLNIESRRGNADRTRQIELQLAELRPNDTLRAPYVLESQAHRHAWSGQFTEASRMFSTMQDRTALAADRIFVRSVNALCLALAGSSQDSARAVAETLDRLGCSSENTEFGRSQLEAAQLFCTVAEAVCGRHTAAQRLLKRSALSTRESMICIREAVKRIVDFAKNRTAGIEDLDQAIEMIRSFGYGGYAKYLLLAIESVKKTFVQEVALKLTPAEVKIVRSLALGHKPKEIAAEMDRSVFTIQTHIQNVIEKLGCHGRIEAIAVARRMGYLEEA